MRRPRRLLGELPRDEEGRLVIGDPTLGCPYCGQVEMKYAQTGNAVVYHPGTLCCQEAIARQIAAREQEIALRRTRISQQFEALKRLEEEALAFGSSRSAAAEAARWRFEKAQKGVPAQVAAIEVEVGEVYDELLEAQRAQRAVASERQREST